MLLPAACLLLLLVWSGLGGLYSMLQDTPVGLTDTLGSTKFSFDDLVQILTLCADLDFLDHGSGHCAAAAVSARVHALRLSWHWSMPLPGRGPGAVAVLHSTIGMQTIRT